MSQTKIYRQPQYSIPSGATELLLVRHGESRAASLAHPFDLVNGQGDPELSSRGKAQAEKLAKRLHSQKIDAVYVTTMRRTAETAAPLVNLSNLKPKVEADLREVHLGKWEGGLFRIKAAESDPAFLEMQQKEEWGLIPGGESTEALRARIKVALNKITAAHPDQTVLLVSHGGVIGQILSLATGSRPFAFQHVDNASISQIIVSGEEMIVRRFNDTCHLAPTLTKAADPQT
ncbi:MAG: histidine phosphatase family protein [SAR324 cluster bacterium]|nr:histidine phosphatase family protein [SAR324 cluster bacterium]